MPTILPVSDIIDIGDVSTYLSANSTGKAAMFGGSLIRPIPPTLIAMVTDALRWGNDSGAETTASLRKTSNYLYWLTAYQLESQRILNGAGGGSVVPSPAGSGSPNDLDFEVTAGSIMVSGATTLSIPQFIGYNVDFARGGIMQNTTNLNDGSSYYSWNNVTGLFTIFPSASLGELFRIMVDAGGGSVVSPTQSYPFTITSANFEVDGVTYLNSAITTDTLYLQATGTPNTLLIEGTDFIHVTGGIEITLSGFDANTNDYFIVINKLN